MTCAEFQKVLPDIIDTGGSEQEQEHLRTCHICSDLVRDLKYIVEQAKLLVPWKTRSQGVEQHSEHSVEHEGLAKPHGKAQLLGLIFAPVALGACSAAALSSIHPLPANLLR